MNIKRQVKNKANTTELAVLFYDVHLLLRICVNDPRKGLMGSLMFQEEYYESTKQKVLAVADDSSVIHLRIV
jgi:hypothetical protein